MWYLTHLRICRLEMQERQPGARQQHNKVRREESLSETFCRPEKWSWADPADTDLRSRNIAPGRRQWKPLDLLVQAPRGGGEASLAGAGRGACQV